MLLSQDIQEYKRRVVTCMPKIVSLPRSFPLCSWAPTDGSAVIFLSHFILFAFFPPYLFIPGLLIVPYINLKTLISCISGDLSYTSSLVIRWLPMEFFSFLWIVCLLCSIIRFGGFSPNFQLPKYVGYI